MVNAKDNQTNPSNSDPASGKPGDGDPMLDGLRMSPDLMLDLARQAAEIVVDRTRRLPEGIAWDGEFRESSRRR